MTATAAPPTTAAPVLIDWTTTRSDRSTLLACTICDATHGVLCDPDRPTFCHVGRSWRVGITQPGIDQLAATAERLEAAGGLDVDEMTDQTAGALAIEAADQLRSASIAIPGITSSPVDNINAAHARLSHLESAGKLGLSDERWNWSGLKR